MYSKFNISDVPITLVEYRRLAPADQGYAAYVWGQCLNSELVNEVNPYKVGSLNFKAWNRGQAVAAADEIAGKQLMLRFN